MTWSRIYQKRFYQIRSNYTALATIYSLIKEPDIKLLGASGRLKLTEYRPTMTLSISASGSELDLTDSYCVFEAQVSRALLDVFVIQ